jgi:predicted Zn-dependent protease
MSSLRHGTCSLDSMRMTRSLASAALIVTAACATNPATGQRQLMLMSEQQEIQLGRDNDQEVRKQMGLYKDPEIQRYVNDVGQRLARASHRPNLPWTFAVVDSPAVNAFALPGGYIYITRGIMPFLRDEAELAAVLGHEVGHVDARHSASAYSKQQAFGGALAVAGVFAPRTQPLQGLAGAALGVLFLKYTRENELEADRLGTGYASTAGWDPGAMPNLLTTLGRLDEASGSSKGVPNWLLTHPQAADRVTLVQGAVSAARAAGGRATNQDALERRLNNLVYGDSREQGIVRGSDFYHPDLRFTLRFPAGWEVMNSAEQVTARAGENSNAAMVLELANVSGSVEQAARSQMATAGFRQLDGQPADINGLQAYVGVYDGAIENTPIRVRAAHIRSNNQTYLVAGVAPPAEFSRADATFSNTIRSFRALSAAEAERIQPSRVEFRTVRAGDTWDSLARAAGDPNVKASTLAIMNGASPTIPPRPGDRIRVVVAG